MGLLSTLFGKTETGRKRLAATAVPGREPSNS